MMLLLNLTRPIEAARTNASHYRLQAALAIGLPADHGAPQLAHCAGKPAIAAMSPNYRRPIAINGRGCGLAAAQKRSAAPVSKNAGVAIVTKRNLSQLRLIVKPTTSPPD